MALRSRPRTVHPTSGPGRGPGSDSRTRDRPRRSGEHTRRHRRSTAAPTLRLRAENLFAEAAEVRRELGSVPPGESSGTVRPPAGTTTGTGSGGPHAPAPVAPHPPPPVAAPHPSAPVEAFRANQSSAAAPAHPPRDADVLVAPVPRATSGTATSGIWRERIGPAVRGRLPLWLQSRCGLERRSVAALSVLLVMAVVLAVQHFWTGRTQPVRPPEAMRASAPYAAAGARHADRPREPGVSSEPEPTGTGGIGAKDGTGGTDRNGETNGATVVVDVGGKVREPGLQRLPAGSRVADALLAAGGVRPGTNTDALNRARLLVDGEQIVVGGPAPAPGVAPAGGITGGSAAGAAPTTPVSLSTATVDQLDALPGVGPVLAQHIVDYRAQHGGFRSVDELREVNGIGERRFADLRKLVRP
ncbi:ComEA family DNA-binding protein [Streptomyces sp. NPDC047022]|uniref:ComEA family DNA-binding protein n=1 Tax=Streptomyces sp. NPDC047022 TaxID=3155737 RepID=UPI0033C5C83A